MKLWLIPAVSLLLFTGCSTKSNTLQLQKVNARQAMVIREQQAQIDILLDKLRSRKKSKVRRRVSKIPTAPKRKIKLRKVEDNNYSSSYMYPGSKKTKNKKMRKHSSLASNSTMGRAECISIIGQAKFDKYTQMFGNEAASLKRCKMLKAMKN